MVRGSKNITKTTSGSKVSVKDADDDEENTNTKAKKMTATKNTNKKSTNNPDDVIFESAVDGIVVTNRCRFWIYVMMNNQWEVVLKNIQNNMLHIGAYTGKSIAANDVILFYMKADKGKGNASGFVAIGQIKTDMEKNMDGIKVFSDKNLNRYVTELSAISIFGNPCKISEFNDLIIEASDSKIKGSTRFALVMLKGECTFTEIVIKKLGLELVKKIFELTNLIVEEEVIDEEEISDIETDQNNDTDDSPVESETGDDTENDTDDDTDNDDPEEEPVPKTRKSIGRAFSTQKSKTAKPPSKKITKIPTKNKPKPTTKQLKKVQSDEEDEDTDIESDAASDVTSDQGSVPGSDSDDDHDDQPKKAVKKTVKSKKSKKDSDNQIVVKGKGKAKEIIRQKKFSDNEESDFSEDEPIKDDDEDDDEEESEDHGVEGNIPVMLIICPKLRKVLSKLREPLNKVKSVLDHYKFCDKCDITNNNSREMYMTLNRIDQLTIKFVDNGYTNALNAYLSMEPFPKYVGIEYIKMYHMLDSEHYQGDVLIEYTSKVDPIIDVVEEKHVKVKSKTKKDTDKLKTTKSEKPKKKK